MNAILFCLLIVPMFSGTTDLNWNGDLNAALTRASSEKKFILLNFSGSDWCGPCIRMHREIFDTDAFRKLATEKLILVQADFPRQKKNQPTSEQIVRNEAMAEKYNPNGIFPLTLLIDANGKVLMSWEGFYKEGPASFATLIASKTIQ